MIGWGKTQIFMKHPQTLFLLELTRANKLPAIADIIRTQYLK